MPITHAFHNPHADGTDTTLTRPSDWNANHTGTLTQAQSHDSPDTDSAPTALHHTLGTGANQALAGNTHIPVDPVNADWLAVSGLAQILNKPATFPATPHNLLSTTHGDTLAGAVTRGDLITGNSTPAWSRLAHPGSAWKILLTNATDTLWSTASFNLSTDVSVNSFIINSITIGPAGSASTINLNFNQNLSVTATTSINSASIGLASYTLTVPATGTAAVGAGTLSASSTNNVATATHTHAITSSSNPGAAAAILATDANGIITVQRLLTPGNTSNSTVTAGALELQSYAVANSWVGENVYYNGSNFVYRATAAASLMRFLAGGFSFYTAASGTAGNTVTLNLMFNATSDQKLGFYGATGVTKPSVTGSRGANAALASLLTALANIGLITDSTSA